MGTLVIAPHPDDEVLGCGGSIALDRDAGRVVQVAFLTSGEQGGGGVAPEQLGPLREQEAVHAAAVLGAHHTALKFLRLPDGGLDERDLEQTRVLVELLRQTRPDLVCIPHAADGSYDHQAAHRLCWRALGLAASTAFPAWAGAPYWVPTVLGYEVWTPIASPALLRSIDDVAERKAAALGCYRSQSPRVKGQGQASHVSPAGLHLAGFRGASTIGGSREAFSVLRLAEVPR